MQLQHSFAGLFNFFICSSQGGTKKKKKLFQDVWSTHFFDLLSLYFFLQNKAVESLVLNYSWEMVYLCWLIVEYLCVSCWLCQSIFSGCVSGLPNRKHWHVFKRNCGHSGVLIVVFANYLQHDLWHMNLCWKYRSYPQCIWTRTNHAPSRTTTIPLLSVEYPASSTRDVFFALCWTFSQLLLPFFSICTSDKSSKTHDNLVVLFMACMNGV